MLVLRHCQLTDERSFNCRSVVIDWIFIYTVRNQPEYEIKHICKRLCVGCKLLVFTPERRNVLRRPNRRRFVATALGYKRVIVVRFSCIDIGR